MEVPRTPHPRDIRTDKTYTNGNDGTTKDSLGPPNNSLEFIEYL